MGSGSGSRRAEDESFVSQAEGAGEPRSPLNLRQIEVFRAIMVAGSVSGAGRMLHVSQPAISRVLALTESRLGFKLFERQRTRLVPTPEAQRLFGEVEGLYRGIRRVNDLAVNLARSGTGSLRVVTSASYAQRLVPLALQRFAQSHPNVQIDCRNVTYDEVAARFLTGDADVGISMLAPVHANLQATPLGQDQLVCLMPGDHPLAGQPVLSVDALRSSPWIGYPPGAPLGQLVSGLLGAEAAASAQVIVHSPVTAIAFAQQGLGAALVVRWSLPPTLPPGMVVRAIEPATPVGIWAISSNLAPLPVLATRFLAAVGQILQAENG
ncbi:LysR family transcriptional regulator [Ramlibacter sp.]|uniref:LysR family transcriptional regulator n=1 Tax=Ramlibacter sp. TaxID=1917967 RepID=UPI002CBF0461|nr:LysR substrate-binding domain-containing protein [Ramlibacter sp.]HWI81754.1 LysR substrate-binding domain-containing protein [Ramlibacter sp.]